MHPKVYPQGRVDFEKSVRLVQYMEEIKGNLDDTAESTVLTWKNLAKISAKQRTDMEEIREHYSATLL